MAEWDKELGNRTRNEEFRARVRQLLFDNGYPEYGLALNAFRQVVPFDGKVIGATDYSNLYLNNKLTDEELCIVVRHEILHALLKHKSRYLKQVKKNHEAWNISADIELSNYYSVADNKTLEASETLKCGCYIARYPMFREMTADEIYGELMAKAQTVYVKISGGGEGQSGSGDNSQSGDSDGDTQEEQDGTGNGNDGENQEEDKPTLDEAHDDLSKGNDNNEEQSAEEAEAQEERLRGQMEIAIKAGYDSLSDEEKEQVKNSPIAQSIAGTGIGAEREKPEIDEVTKLRYDLHAYFIKQERVEKGRTYRKPNKKYINSPYIVKGRSNKYKDSKTIACYVDVSGSMSESMIRKGLEVVKGLQEIKRVEVEVFYFDTQIHKEFRSGGGTDYNAILNHADKNKYTCIAIITDNTPITIEKHHTLEAFWLIGIERCSGEYHLATQVKTPTHAGSGMIMARKFQYNEVLP
jgi:predicted metal-dependent peptidase